MSPKGGKADYLEIGVNLRTVVDDLQLFSIKGCALIAP